MKASSKIAQDDYIRLYHKGITSGEIDAPKYIIGLYNLIIKGLEKGLFFYDHQKAIYAINFIESFCHHCEGRNDLLTLELWQKAAVAVIFGVVDTECNRQFREVFLVVGRKNGKSLFATAIEEYMAFADGEYGAKIYCLAPKLEQANIIYGNFYHSVEREPELLEAIQKRRSDIYIPYSNTTVKAIAFNAKKSDGFNPHMASCDEIAAWNGDQGIKQYEVMKSALGARRQPLILSITTAGYVSDGIYDELMKRSTAYLNGTSEETRLLPLLYIIDDPEKWDDLTELRKSNPNMGVSVTEDYFREEIAIAKGSLSKKAEFLCKYCNLKQNSTTAWLTTEQIEPCFGEHLELADFAHSYCVGGFDLSQTTDLTAATVTIERNKKLYVFAQFWMPAEKVDELTERDHVPYRTMIERGWLRTSGEHYVQYSDVYDWYVSLVRDYEILPLQIGYDRYSSQYLVQDLCADGFHTDDVYQGENLTPVMTEFVGMLDDRKICCGDNQLLKAHLYNVAVKENLETRRMKPVKIEPRCHIDGFVAIIDGLTVRQKWYDEIGEQLKNEGE